MGKFSVLGESSEIYQTKTIHISTYVCTINNLLANLFIYQTFLSKPQKISFSHFFPTKLSCLRYTDTLPVTAIEILSLQ